MKQQRPIALATQAKFFRGLGDPGRLSLLMCLRSGPLAAGDLANAAALTLSNASNHLQCLLECGLVEVRSEGRQNIYRLADAEVSTLLDATEHILRTRAGTLIEECEKYGPPSRRRLRARTSEPAKRGTVGRNEPPGSRRKPRNS